MVMLDANAVLRYLLNDNEDMANQVEHIIHNEPTIVTIEVIAEVYIQLNA